MLMIIGKSFFFYLHLHINCVAPPCFTASQDKAFAYRIYMHFTQQCRTKPVGQGLISSLLSILVLSLVAIFSPV